MNEKFSEEVEVVKKMLFDRGALALSEERVLDATSFQAALLLVEVLVRRLNSTFPPPPPTA